jgi:single-stranded DNA-binding protein
MYENLTVIGYVGKVTRKAGEKPYIRLSVAASAHARDKDGETQEKTNWYTVTLWDKKQVERYKDKIKKGDFVLASGAPEVRLYTAEGEKRVDVAIKTDFGGVFRVLRYAAAPDGE